MANINHKGSVKYDAHMIIRDIWLWCLEFDNYVVATFLPGAQNNEADFQSRIDRHQVEWKLNEELFNKIMNKFGNCDIDLFASRVNNQLPVYVSFTPDPYAFWVDSFTLDWSLYKGYIFPPFGIILKVLQKIELDQALCVIIVPLWTSQTWFPKLLKLLIDHPVLLPSRPYPVRHPLTGQVHPTKTKMMACILSGKVCLRKAFQESLQKLSYRHGGKGQKSLIDTTSKDGSNFVLKGRGILLQSL